MQRQSKIPFIWVDLMTNRRIPSANRTNELGQRYYIHSDGDNQAGQLVAVHRVAAGVKQKRGRVKKVAGSHPGPIERGDIMYYKLTNQNMKTYNGFQWELGKWYEIPEEDQGDDSLCSNSYFHCYKHPVLAVIFNPIHAKFDNPRLFEIAVEGDSKEALDNCTYSVVYYTYSQVRSKRVNFFRLQAEGHTLEQMQQYQSTDVDGTQYDGVCADTGPDDGFGGGWSPGLDPKNDEGLEVVIFKGQITQEIYDGVVVQPAEEIARFSVSEWREKLADGTAWDYEDWS